MRYGMLGGREVDGWGMVERRVQTKQTEASGESRGWWFWMVGGQGSALATAQSALSALGLLA